ncbi:MAG: hypothetical protein P1U40_03075 [Coxiellaceae bacterium]|nr:hypothetical protein [Coxiellaceae bacterium]
MLKLLAALFSTCLLYHVAFGSPKHSISDLLTPLPGPVHTSAGTMNFTSAGGGSITQITATIYKDFDCLTQISSGSPQVFNGTFTPAAQSYTINGEAIHGNLPIDSNAFNDSSLCMVLSATGTAAITGDGAGNWYSMTCGSFASTNCFASGGRTSQDWTIG